jgi:hypothetical protein
MRRRAGLCKMQQPGPVPGQRGWRSLPKQAHVQVHRQQQDLCGACTLQQPDGFYVPNIKREHLLPLILLRLQAVSFPPVGVSAQRCGAVDGVSI